MILLLPYKRLAFKTPFSPSMAEQRLAERIKPRQLVRFQSIFTRLDDVRPFEGKVEKGRFTIKRIVSGRYQNSAAVIDGRFQDGLDHTRVELTVRMNYLSVALIPIMIVIFAISTGAASAAGVDGGGWVAFPAAAIALLLYVFTMGSFNYEVARARQFLEETFQTTVDELA